jgi:hypothetical protein
MEELMEWADGNPGALTFLMGIFLSNDTSISDMALVAVKLKSYKTLRGTNIYVLWSDLCDKNNNKVFHLLRTCPQEVLEDACSRQDYSGIELIKEYLT